MTIQKKNLSVVRHGTKCVVLPVQVCGPVVADLCSKIQTTGHLKFLLQYKSFVKSTVD